MSGESYTRWRSDPSDEEEGEEDDSVMKSGHGSSAVTIVPMSNRAAENIKEYSQWRMICVLVLVCGICSSVGGLIGYSIGSWKEDDLVMNDMPRTMNFTYKEYGTDFGKYVYSFRTHLQPQIIKNYMRKISETKRNLLTDYIESTWRLQGLQTTTTTFTVALSKPDRDKPNTVEVEYMNGHKEFLVPLLHKEETPPFLAYSPAGVVSGPVVYGHYGRREDLQTLQTLKVTIKGAILLLRHGKLHAGTKLRNAEQAGAIGVLIYPDPIDYQGKRGGGDPYPNGTGLPEDGVIWKTLNTLPGDPETPFLPSLDNIYRASKNDNHLRIIPAHTISSRAASKLMSLIDGPKVPNLWQGGLKLVSLGGNTTKQEYYKLGGSWLLKTKNLTLSVYNIMYQELIRNVHASLPALDNTRVIMIGCHYGALHKEPGVGLASLLALSESLAKAFSQRGTERKVVFSAWAASQYGMVGSTEFAQLYSAWLDKRLLGYLSLDEMLVGTGTLRVMASPTLRESIREAADMVDWLEKSESGVTVTVRKGWRMADPTFLANDVHISSPGSGSDFVSFTAQNGIPSAHFVAMGKNWTRTYSLEHTQYDTLEAYTKLLDPEYKWAHMITSLVGAVVVVLSEKELPPVRFSEMSGDLYNGWRRFLDLHEGALNNSGYDFQGTIDAIGREIEILDEHMKCLDAWYNDTSVQENKVFIDDHKARYFHMEHHRRIEERLQQLMTLERGLLGPRGVGRSYTTNVMIGPDPEDPESPIHYPHAARSITLALRHKTPWESVHQELSYILASLMSFRDLFHSQHCHSS